MNTRLIPALALSAVLLASPAFALPVDPPARLLLSLWSWVSSFWAEADAGGCLDPNGLNLMPASEESSGCLDPNGKPVPCNPTGPLSSDSSGCLDPNGRPVPCSPTGP